MIYVNDYVRVRGKSYRVPPTATRASMELAMFYEDRLTPQEVRLKERLKASATGGVRVDFVARVRSIVSDIAVLVNLSTGAIEHATIDQCEKVTICAHCGTKEAIYRGVCDKRECREHMQ